MKGVGGYKTGGGGGNVEFYPYEKGEGGRKSFSHVEGGGGRTGFGIVFTQFSHFEWVVGGGGVKGFTLS